MTSQRAQRRRLRRVALPVTGSAQPLLEVPDVGCPQSRTEVANARELVQYLCSQLQRHRIGFASARKLVKYLRSQRQRRLLELWRTLQHLINEVALPEEGALTRTSVRITAY